MNRIWNWALLGVLIALAAGGCADDAGSGPFEVEVSGGAILISVFPQNAEVTGYTGSPTEIVIPADFNGLPVTAIGDHALDGCTSLLTATVPASVNIIDEYAFWNCTSMIALHLQNPVPGYIGWAGLHTNAPSPIFYVPASPDHSTLIAYQTGNYWSIYGGCYQEEP